LPRPPSRPRFPYTTLFRSGRAAPLGAALVHRHGIVVGRLPGVAVAGAVRVRALLATGRRRRVLAMVGHGRSPTGGGATVRRDGARPRDRQAARRVHAALTAAPLSVRAMARAKATPGDGDAATRVDVRAEAAEAAEAGLLYVCDEAPGLRRLRCGRGFRYVDAGGRTVRDPDTLDRIRALAIPPAYRDVWSCASPPGHLQATGRDARGRKQYRYHADWRRHRDSGKFERLPAFSAALPRLRRAVRADLALPGFPRDKVLALVVRILAGTFV